MPCKWPMGMDLMFLLVPYLSRGFSGGKLIPADDSRTLGCELMSASNFAAAWLGMALLMHPRMNSVFWPLS
eukprot:2872311-Amphidinium_carterae.1